VYLLLYFIYIHEFVRLLSYMEGSPMILAVKKNVFTWEENILMWNILTWKRNY